MLETPDDIDRLQRLLDDSAAGAGPHLRGIITGDRRLSAAQVSRVLQGMRLLVVATVTADGRPLVGPVDGYFLHGSFYFSSGRDSVRVRHSHRGAHRRGEDVHLQHGLTGVMALCTVWRRRQWSCLIATA
jgi:Pyridoxamine 5'-phosphate oxidase